MEQALPFCQFKQVVSGTRFPDSQDEIAPDKRANRFRQCKYPEGGSLPGIMISDSTTTVATNANQAATVGRAKPASGAMKTAPKEASFSRKSAGGSPYT